jgi:hypothetical protein
MANSTLFSLKIWRQYGPISPKESPPPRPPPPPPKSLSISKAGSRWDNETAKSVLNYWSWVVKGSKLIQLQLGGNGKNRKNGWDFSPVNSRQGGGVVGQKKTELGDSRIKPIQLHRFKNQAHSTPAFRHSCRVAEGLWRQQRFRKKRESHALLHFHICLLIIAQTSKFRSL